MRRLGQIVVTIVVLGTPGTGAWAQDAELQTTESVLAEVGTYGGIATLASVCGIRDESWSQDLRRSAIQGATGVPHPDDQSLRAAPGGDLAASALAAAEVEALENFAAQPPAAACASLAANPDLTRADAMVAAYRQQMTAAKRQS